MNTTLPPQGPHEPDDELPEEAGLAALYRKLPQNEPSPALDAAILHAAAQAISAPSDTTRLPHGERRKTAREPGDWVRPKPVTEIASTRQPRPSTASRAPRHRTLVALGSAASLVLVAGLAWHMRDMPSQESAPAAARDALDSPARGVPVAAVPATPPGVAAKASMSQEMSKDRAATGNAATDVAANAAPAAPAKPVAQPAMAMREQKPVVVAVTATPIVEPAAQPILRKSEADKAVPPPPAPPAPALEEVSSAPAMPAPPAPPAPPSPAEPQFAPRITGGLMTDESQAQDASPAQVRELAAIRKLFAEHHNEEAQRRLEAFHRLHPQWQLSPDLQARLRKP